ncbi:MAG: endo-1,4-beta-xylanase [Planctomycetota bacterium]
MARRFLRTAVLAGVGVCTTATAPAGGQVNLAPNPGYEFGLLAWSATSGATFTTQSDVVRTGSLAAQLTNRDDEDDGLGATITGLEPGKGYEVTAWMRAEGPAPTNFGLTVRVIDDLGTNFLALERRGDLPGDTWVEVRGIYWHQPVGESDVFIYVQKPAAGRTVYVDDWTITELPDWREQSDAGIEAYRKRDLRIEVVDALGDPLPGADITVEQTRRRFGFGSAVSSVLINNTLYRSLFFDTFGFEWATFQNETKWREMEPAQDVANYGTVDALLGVLQPAGIKVHAHTLFWGSKMTSEPAWVSQLPVDDLQQEINERIDETMSRYAGVFESWDVNNELINDNDYYSAQLGPDTVPEMFRRAHQADPTTKYVLNETGPLVAGPNASRDKVQALKDLVASLEASSPPVTPDAVHVQGHFRFTSVNPYIVRDRLDQIAEMGLPIWISELDILEPDDDFRADQFEWLYRVALGHPGVQGVMAWGFWGADHWLGEDAVFVDDDWTINAAGQRFIDLNSEWRTDATGQTDPAGALDLRGFHGTYDITVSYADISETFTVELVPGEGGQIVPLAVDVRPDCPADLVAPAGTVDMSDLDEVLDRFGGACGEQMIDFEGDTPGHPVAGQGMPVWTGSATIAEIQASNGLHGSQAIRVIDDLGAAFAEVSFAPTEGQAGGPLDGTGLVRTRLSLRQVSPVKTDGRVFRQTLALFLGRTGSSQIVRINIKEDGGLTLGVAGAGEVTVLDAGGEKLILETGQWIDIEVVTDFDAQTQATRVNDVIQPATGLATSFDGAVPEYGSFVVRYANNADASEAFDIDNISVTRLNADGTPARSCDTIDRVVPITVIDAFDLASLLAEPCVTGL